MKYIGGFTTVELLTTLFVAVLFIASGYQLYTLTNRQAVTARAMAEAGNIAHEVLHSEGAEPTAVSVLCTAAESSHPSQAVSRSVSNLPDLEITIRRCRPVASSGVIRVSVFVSHNDVAEDVVHAAYVIP